MPSLLFSPLLSCIYNRIVLGMNYVSLLNILVCHPLSLPPFSRLHMPPKTPGWHSALWCHDSPRLHHLAPSILLCLLCLPFLPPGYLQQEREGGRRLIRPTNAPVFLPGMCSSLACSRGLISRSSRGGSQGYAIRVLKGLEDTVWELKRGKNISKVCMCVVQGYKVPNTKFKM